MSSIRSTLTLRILALESSKRFCLWVFLCKKASLLGLSHLPKGLTSTSFSAKKLLFQAFLIYQHFCQVFDPQSTWTSFINTSFFCQPLLDLSSTKYLVNLDPLRLHLLHLQCPHLTHNISCKSNLILLSNKPKHIQTIWSKSTTQGYYTININISRKRKEKLRVQKKVWKMRYSWCKNWINI